MKNKITFQQYNKDPKMDKVDNNRPFDNRFNFTQSDLYDRFFRLSQTITIDILNSRTLVRFVSAFIYFCTIFFHVSWHASKSVKLGEECKTQTKDR